MSKKKNPQKQEKTISGMVPPVVNKAYDDTPYESFSYPQTHPAHTAMVGHLFGFPTVDFRKARVLELGCAGGGNLFPQAYLYPDAYFLGIDSSGQQIGQALHMKAALKLRNVDFVQEDIMSFSSQTHGGKFDYIICHGVFSWVPGPVRDKMLEICKNDLSENGLAVISYNALPGWNIVRSVREMMLYHTARFSVPAEKIREARGFLDFLSKGIPTANTVWRAVIDEEIKILKNVNDAYILHDHLEKDNTQFYLNDFTRLAGEKGLDYVGDSMLSSMYVGNMSESVLKQLKAISDVVMQEQYIDFLVNRRFRYSILCHKGHKLKRSLEHKRIMDFHLSSTMIPQQQEGVAPGTFNPSKEIVFKASGGGTFVPRDPQTAILMLELATCGNRPVAAEELAARAQKKQGFGTEKSARDLLIQNGMQLALYGYINLHLTGPYYTRTVSEKPVAYPLARLQAAVGKCKSVTNVLSTYIETNEMMNFVIKHLDGSKSVAEITELMVKAIGNKELQIIKDVPSLANMQGINEALKAMVKDIVASLVRQGLLVE